jgi:hypothetical protein
VEKAKVRDALNSERFMDLAPREIYAILLDEGKYLYHWRTMYRILAEHNEVRERRNLHQHPNYKRPKLLASGPNQVWSWDITLLRGRLPLMFYYLYAVLDIYSRYIVSRNLFPSVIPPTLPVVNEDLAESVTTVLRRGMKKQESHFFACGNGQHLLTGVNETAIITDRVFGLLSMIHDSDRLGQEYLVSI